MNKNRNVLPAQTFVLFCNTDVTELMQKELDGHYTVTLVYLLMMSSMLKPVFFGGGLGAGGLGGGTSFFMDRSLPTQDVLGVALSFVVDDEVLGCMRSGGFSTVGDGGTCTVDKDGGIAEDDGI